MSRYPLYRYKKFFGVAFLFCIVAIYLLAMLPQEKAPQLGWSDKGNHVFAFVVLGLLLRLGFRISYWRALALLIAYGAFVELSQYFTPTRSAELADVAADTIGAHIRKVL
ncbi:MAG: VanZ family protein [Sulfurovum sp.]|nr:VanZ family protein [Sulfurovum sp.]